MSITNAVFENQYLLDDVKSLAKKFDFVQKNAETYINEYFQSAIRDVDLRREQLKAKIDDYSDVLIESLKTKHKKQTKRAHGTPDQSGPQLPVSPKHPRNP